MSILDQKSLPFSVGSSIANFSVDKTRQAKCPNPCTYDGPKINTAKKWLSPKQLHSNIGWNLNISLLDCSNIAYFAMKRLIIGSEDYSVLRYIKEQICRDTSHYGVTVREDEYSFENKRKLLKTDE